MINHFYRLFSDRFCDALGDKNVWGTLFPYYYHLTYNDFVLATAKVRTVYRETVFNVFEKHLHCLFIQVLHKSMTYPVLTSQCF